MKLGKSSSLNASLEKEHLTSAFLLVPLDTKLTLQRAHRDCVYLVRTSIPYRRRFRPLLNKSLQFSILAAWSRLGACCKPATASFPTN